MIPVAGQPAWLRWAESGCLRCCRGQCSANLRPHPRIVHHERMSYRQRDMTRRRQLGFGYCYNAIVGCIAKEALAEPVASGSGDDGAGHRERWQTIEEARIGEVLTAGAVAGSVPELPPHP